VPLAETGTRNRVLVVDDEVGTLRLMEVVFQMEGFDVVTARGGEEALTLVGSCDIVVLDLMMPGMDGLSVLREIRADPTVADLPVLMFTARTDTLAAKLAETAGVSGFHTKPVDIDRLVADVRHLLDVRAAKATPARTADD